MLPVTFSNLASTTKTSTLQVKGMNSLFGLKIQIGVGDNLVGCRGGELSLGHYLCERHKLDPLKFDALF